MLIVDDQASMLLLVTKIFEKIGFTNIESTRDADAALQLMRERRFGLAISDWHMQPVSGLALLRAAREDERARRTPFIITSIDMSPGAIHAAHVAGADAYLLKPYGPETLRAKIESVFKTRTLLPRPAE